jgi:hypothetical protein
MNYIESFSAYDENGNEYRVEVYGKEFKPQSGKIQLIKSYNLESTKEVLEHNKKQSDVFKIKSSNTLIKMMW